MSEGESAIKDKNRVIDRGGKADNPSSSSSKSKKGGKKKEEILNNDDEKKKKKELMQLAMGDADAEVEENRGSKKKKGKSKKSSKKDNLNIEEPLVVELPPENKYWKLFKRYCCCFCFSKRRNPSSRPKKVPKDWKKSVNLRLDAETETPMETAEERKIRCCGTIDHRYTGL